jgi:serine/threonine protein kinase
VSDYSASDALLGRTLGSSRLERRLGVGGMGAIYLAQQERPRRQVAVKVLRPQALADAKQWPLFLARFRREADATAALDHANIVPIYEFGEQDDLAYLVMPYLPDGSLADLLAREGPLPIPQALTYIDQIASALDYAHQHGIVHRDVKPSNLLLHPDGRLLLADFGIARPLDQRDLPNIALASDMSHAAGLTVGGGALGTPDYMAPEQIRGKRVGPSADIYALGIVTYAALTGRTPFGGGTTTEVLARQLSDPPPPLRYSRPDVPARVEEVIFWALAKEAAERPQTAGAFAQSVRDGARGSLGALLKRAAGVGAPLASLRGVGEPSAAPPTPRYGVGVSSGDATLWDPSFHGGGGAGNPAWPGARRAGGGSSPRPGGISAALLAAVALALVVLIIMGIMVGSALGNTFGSNFTSLLPVTRNATPLPTPTATVTPTPSPSPTPTPPPNWLNAQPDSIQLGCHHNKTGYIVLTNQGPSPLGWVAQVPPDFFSGIMVSPTSGTLDQRGSVKITVTNTASLVDRSGNITFNPTNGDAGAAAVVNYSANAC